MTFQTRVQDQEQDQTTVTVSSAIDPCGLRQLQFYVFDRMQRPRRMLYQGAGNRGGGASRDRATVIRWCNMPRLRKPLPSSEFQPDRFESVEAQQAGTRRRSVGDVVRFFRAIAEIERLHGLPVHPESPTMH